MDLDEFQHRARRTAIGASDQSKAEQIAVLGLAGEAASIAAAYKKRLRDGDAFASFHQSVAEELGDTLWYLAMLADYNGLSLNQIAEENLAKTGARFLPSTGTVRFYDADVPPGEQLPRRFQVRFTEDPSTKTVSLDIDGKTYGATLNDNALEEDGYRYHDAFHFAFWAFLAWSPVMRALLRRKRKSRPEIDEAEDGARASALEEGVSAMIYFHAKQHDFYQTIAQVDYGILRSISIVTATLEVKNRTLYDWEQAIIWGARSFAKLYEKRGGSLLVDAEARTLVYRVP